MRTNPSNHWIDDRVHEFLHFVPPLKKELYYRVAEIVSENQCQKILDFGCGDGNQIPYLTGDIQYDLYDVNHFAALRAFEKYSHSRSNLSLLKDIHSAQSSSYDGVILNMVWMCLEDEYQISQIVSEMRRVKREKGLTVVSLTNPYVRNHKFSYFDTEYSIGERPFEYSKNGEPFKVFIKDPTETVFTDYHWRMDFTLEVFVNAGFMIEKLVDIADVPYKDFANHSVPPYSIIVLR